MMGYGRLWIDASKVDRLDRMMVGGAPANRFSPRLIFGSNKCVTNIGNLIIRNFISRCFLSIDLCYPFNDSSA